MAKMEPFSLVDISSAMSQSMKKRSTIWKHVAEGRFPPPVVSGTARACWLQIQITNYLYQVARYGEWSSDRANEALDIVYESELAAGVNSNGGELNHVE